MSILITSVSKALLFKQNNELVILLFVYSVLYLTSTINKITAQNLFCFDYINFSIDAAT